MKEITRLEIPHNEDRANLVAILGVAGYPTCVKEKDGTSRYEHVYEVIVYEKPLKEQS